MQKEQIEGREFDWFISDMNGNIALCSGAGFDEIPSSVLDGLVETEFMIGSTGAALMNELFNLASQLTSKV